MNKDEYINLMLLHSFPNIFDTLWRENVKELLFYATPLDLSTMIKLFHWKTRQRIRSVYVVKLNAFQL